MTEGGTWRNLRSVMLVTLHVAAISALIRYFHEARGTDASLVVWVPVAIAVAALISWPISRAFFEDLDATRRSQLERTCPACRRIELRPLVRPGGGIFQAVSNYRCAACRTTVRVSEGSMIVEPSVLKDGTPNPSGICFLDEASVAADEIRYLDETPKSAV